MYFLCSMHFQQPQPNSVFLQQPAYYAPSFQNQRQILQNRNIRPRFQNLRPRMKTHLKKKMLQL